MQAPCVRHAAMLIEQAAYEGNGGVGLIVPDELFPPRPQRVGWSYAYRDELQASPRLAEMLRDHGVNHVCEAAGLTALERDAVLLRAGGLSWGDITERFATSGAYADRGSVRKYAIRGRSKLLALTHAAIGRGE